MDFTIGIDGIQKDSVSNAALIVIAPISAVI